MTFPVSDEILVAEALSGALPTRMAEAGRQSDDGLRAAFEGQLTALHNGGGIDLLALAAGGAFGRLPEGEPYWAIEVFANVLPDLVGGVAAMLDAAAQLARDGDGYGAGGAANGPFRTWLGREVGRAAELQRRAEAGQADAAEYAVFAFEVQADLANARRAAREGRGAVQRGALLALSRMPHADADERARTYGMLSAVLDQDLPGEARANALFVTVNLLAAAGSDEPEGLALLDRLLQPPWDEILFAVAHLLSRYGLEPPPGAVHRLLEALFHIPAGDPNRLGQADLALVRRVEAGAADAVVDWLERRLGAGDDVGLDAFPSTLRRLLADEAWTSRLVVRWFGGGDPDLCTGLNAALAPRERTGGAVVLRPQDLVLPAEALVELACRLTGYFLLQPGLAAGLVVSILREAPEAAVPALQHLVLNVLLDNYDHLRGPLSELDPADPARPRLDEVLRLHAEYIAAAEAVPDLVEFAPPPSRLRVRRLRKLEEMREMAKAVEAQSLVSRIATKMTILYGRAARTRIYEADGSKFVDVEMKRHSVTMPLPMMHLIDPLGLEHQLLQLRQGRLR